MAMIRVHGAAPNINVIGPSAKASGDPLVLPIHNRASQFQSRARAHQGAGDFDATRRFTI